MTISNIKLIVGLGNPEDKYVNTRHNIGYKVIDNLTKQLEDTIVKKPKDDAEMDIISEILNDKK